MGFLELVNRRLDHLKAYNSATHYQDHVYMAKRWANRWKALKCDEVSQDDIQSFAIKRSKVSPVTANKEIRYLRALFNFGIRRRWISSDPTQGIPFMPVEKRVTYVPSKQDVLKVILAAKPEMQDYLWVIKETMAG
jgi:site-specific recombinase XerD